MLGCCKELLSEGTLSPERGQQVLSECYLFCGHSVSVWLLSGSVTLSNLLCTPTSKKAAILQGADYMVSKYPASGKGVLRGRESFGPLPRSLRHVESECLDISHWCLHPSKGQTGRICDPSFHCFTNNPLVRRQDLMEEGGIF